MYDFELFPTSKFFNKFPHIRNLFIIFLKGNMNIWDSLEYSDHFLTYIYRIIKYLYLLKNYNKTHSYMHTSPNQIFYDKLQFR